MDDMEFETVVIHAPGWGPLKVGDRVTIVWHSRTNTYHIRDTK